MQTRRAFLSAAAAAPFAAIHHTAEALESPKGPVVLTVSGAIAHANEAPLRIVYPFDSTPKLNSGVYHGRSVWQLARLEIR